MFVSVRLFNTYSILDYIHFLYAHFFFCLASESSLLCSSFSWIIFYYTISYLQQEQLWIHPYRHTWLYSGRYYDFWNLFSWCQHRYFIMNSIASDTLLWQEFSFSISIIGVNLWDALYLVFNKLLIDFPIMKFGIKLTYFC